jgi:hypothetical protein
LARRRKPLRAVSLVFAGFVTLALLSQLSAHFFAEAIPKHLVPQNAATLSSIQQTSTELAFAASALGLVFAGAVLIITREKIAADVDVYRATGLPSSEAFLRMARSHSIGPLGWVVGAGTAAALVDAYFGLNALIPIGLGVSFALLLLIWLAFLTSASFAQKGFEGRTGGKAG